MADFGAIFSIVAQASSLASGLYKLAATALQDSSELFHISEAVNSFSSAVKHVGTIIRDDDAHISSEAVETLEDVFDQSRAVLTEIDSTLLDNGTSHAGSAKHQGRPTLQLDTAELDRLRYLEAHLNALKATVTVLQQTLYTAQAVIWARVRAGISPQQSEAVVSNEKVQLENVVIEQQICILSASKLFDPVRPDARLLTDRDSSGSLVTTENNGPKPGDLHRYQETSLSSLDMTDTGQHEWLLAVRGISRPYMERLLKRWTRIAQHHENIEREERMIQTLKRESQQPSVESDNEDEHDLVNPFRKGGADLASPPARRPGSVQPLFTEAATLPIPIPQNKYRPAAPLSPASSYNASPRTSGISVASPSAYSPTSPRASFSSPVDAAAAVEAKDNDDDVDLGIPWKLRTREYWWKYIDGKVVDTNTHLPPSAAFTDRHSWTELIASWVCKEAIEEQYYKYRAVKKGREVGRRTKFETCFCIEQPLNFDQVQRLVERTVEIYRSKRPPTPPSADRRASATRTASHDTIKGPLAIQHPPLDRSISYAHTPLPPPPTALERAISLPVAPRLTIPGPSPVQHPSMAPGLYSGPVAHHSYFSQMPPHSPSAPHLPPTFQYSPYGPYLPQPNLAPTPTAADIRRLSANYPVPQPSYPIRPPGHSPSTRHAVLYDSDSDDAARRRHRPRSRRSSTSSQKKKGSSGLGALATVSGLAALLGDVL